MVCAQFVHKNESYSAQYRFRARELIFSSTMSDEQPMYYEIILPSNEELKPYCKAFQQQYKYILHGFSKIKATTHLHTKHLIAF